MADAAVCPCCPGEASSTQHRAFFPSSGLLWRCSGQRGFWLVLGQCCCREVAPLAPSDLTPPPAGETLLSPLVMCGPHGLKFLKAVELRLPHCASMTPDGWSFALKSSDSSSGMLSSLWPLGALGAGGGDPWAPSRAAPLSVTASALSVACRSHECSVQCECGKIEQSQP